MYSKSWGLETPNCLQVWVWVIVCLYFLPGRLSLLSTLFAGLQPSWEPVGRMSECINAWQYVKGPRLNGALPFRWRTVDQTSVSACICHAEVSLSKMLNLSHLQRDSLECEQNVAALWRNMFLISTAQKDEHYIVSTVMCCCVIMQRIYIWKQNVFDSENDILICNDIHRSYLLYLQILGGNITEKGCLTIIWTNDNLTFTNASCCDWPGLWWWERREAFPLFVLNTTFSFTSHVYSQVWMPSRRDCRKMSVAVPILYL